MEDRSSLLKIYNDRTKILNKGNLSLTDLETYLTENKHKISQNFLSVLTSSSIVSGRVRPELFIESILQYLKGKRNYKREFKFIRLLTNDSELITWEDFREKFHENFVSLYDKNEICRILQLVKRFGLDSFNNVTYEYLEKLVKTCHSQENRHHGDTGNFSGRHISGSFIYCLLYTRPTHTPELHVYFWCIGCMSSIHQKYSEYTVYFRCISRSRFSGT